MNEVQFWETRVKPALHFPPKRCAWKVGTSTRAGIPDVIFTAFDGALTGWLELKYCDWPARASTPIRPGTSLDQRAHLRDWRESGGCAFVLLGMPDLSTGHPGGQAFLLPWDHPDAIEREDLPPAIAIQEPGALLEALLDARRS